MGVAMKILITMQDLLHLGFQDALRNESHVWGFLFYALQMKSVNIRRFLAEEQKCTDVQYTSYLV